MPIDAWDGDTEKMSAQSFLRAFHRDVKVTTSSADKASFGNDKLGAKKPAYCEQPAYNHI
jgi:hypothetical protein